MDINEGSLAFKFDAKWNVFKLDEHPFYRNHMEKVDGTKAVDILGVYQKRELYLIEIKDFRGHRIENKGRLLKGGLAIEVAQKVRDSLACIIGAWQTQTDNDFWKFYAELLYKRKGKLKVVIWLETDKLSRYDRMRQKAKASVSTKVFKQKIEWLTSRVCVCSMETHGLDGLKVQNLKK